MAKVKLLSGPLWTERRSDGTRSLLRGLVIDTKRMRIRVPAGFVTDYSTIPWFGRWVVHWSKVDIAGVVHDYLYQEQFCTRKIADQIWKEVAMAGEHAANWLQATTCYNALRAGGWIAWDGYKAKKR